MNIAITDSVGEELSITTDTEGLAFDAIACSPHADGFTALHGSVGDRMPRDQLELACQQSIERAEVCILPRIASTATRVMIVPNSGALDAAGRQKAAVLMMDLVRATKAAGGEAASLLISHFGFVNRYPQLHVLGICDAINELRRQSFLGLRVLGFEVASSIRVRFERDFEQALSTQKSHPEGASK